MDRSRFELPFLADIHIATRIAQETDKSAKLLTVTAQSLPYSAGNAQALGKVLATFATDGGNLIVPGYGPGRWVNPIKGPRLFGLALFDIQEVKLNPGDAIEDFRQQGILGNFRSL